MNEEPKAALNTDRELWREPFPDPPGDFYAPSIHVTQQGGIGINVGGSVYVKPLREWHALARASSPDPASVKEIQGHEFSCPDGELDEVFIANASVHIERMDDTAFWIGIDGAGKPPLMLNTGVHRGQWYFNIEVDSIEDPAFHSVQRPRKGNKTPRGKPHRPDPAKEALVGALKEIAEWRMPDTGQTWPDGSPMSYGSLFGSNGDRDYIISIAERALAEQGHKGATK